MLNAKRPLLIYGAGVRGCVAEAEALRRLTGIPLVVTWGARDIFPDAESFGTHGNRAANFAVQTADYILAVGTRLDTKATGSPASSFAPYAKLVMVDIDGAELDKMAKIGRPLHKAIRADAKAFMLDALKLARADTFPDWSVWKAKIADWRERFPAVDPAWRVETTINPYVLVEKLSELMRPDDVLVSDTGCGLAWLMQAFRFRGQQFVHAFNNTPMGYGLPAAVGAAFATGRRVVLVTGDGGLGVNITELATIARHGLNVHVILLDNFGHSMCRASQRQWFNSEYAGTSVEGGLAHPDFVEVAEAYGIDTYADLARMLKRDGPGFIRIELDKDLAVSPQCKFGFPIHDQEPRLPNVDAILAEALA